MEVLKRLSADIAGNKIHASVTGRNYLFTGAFPTSIQVEGTEILAAPIGLKAEFEGEAKPWDEPYVIPVSQDADTCVYTVQQAAGNAFINARVKLEKDGLIWVDLMLDSYGTWITYDRSRAYTKPTLTSLKLNIPLTKEVAELYHYWPIENSGITQTAAVRNSGAVPEEGFQVPLKPCLWLGKEECGLAFYMESTQYTQPADPQKFYQVKVEGDAVILTIDLLDSMPKIWQGREDDWNDALEPIEFSFGIQATPVKPYERHKDFERVFHTGWKPVEAMDEQALEEYCAHLASKGVKWHTFHEDWSVIQNYGLAWNEAQFKHVVDMLHRYGIRVMVYFGYECATCIPDWFEHKDDYLLKSARGGLRGGWQRAPHQRDFMVCYHGGYSQVMLDRVAHVMDDYGVDGIYTDGTYIPWECANEKHGCGWRDEDGKLHETFPLRAAREHVKKLHEIVHARGGIVEAHQSSCCVPMMLGYADSYFDGEHIQHIFSQNAGGLMNSAIIRSEFNGANFGVTFQFLSITDTYYEGCGVMLLHNSATKVYGKDMMKRLDEANEIWTTMDNFGADDAKFVGYWEETCPVSTDKERVLSSAWVRENGRVLTVTVNLGGEAEEVKLTCGGEVRTVTVPSLKPILEIFEN